MALALLFEDACDLLEWTITDVDEVDEIVGYSEVKSSVVVIVVVGVDVGVDVDVNPLPLAILVDAVTDDELLVFGLNSDFIFWGMIIILLKDDVCVYVYMCIVCMCLCILLVTWYD